MEIRKFGNYRLDGKIIGQENRELQKITKSDSVVWKVFILLSFRTTQLLNGSNRSAITY